MSKTARAHGYSMPLISKQRPSRLASPIKNRNDTNPQSTAIWSRLPTIKLSKILQKIGGAGDRRRSMYVPNEQEQAQFKRKRYQQLRRQYSPHRYVQKQPFQGQLDDIVLGCYNYGQNNGKRSVWKKYRQKCDQLSFDTLKVMKKR